MQGQTGVTALMVAARYGQLECLRLLAGRERGIRDRYGRTALQYTLTGSSSRECALELYRYPEERGAGTAGAVRRRWGLESLRCGDAPGVEARSLVEAAATGCSSIRPGSAC